MAQLGSDVALLPGPVGFLLIPRFTSIAFFSAVESLRIANRYLGGKYQWGLYSVDGEAVPDGNGISIAVHRAIDGGAEVGSLIICADLEPERYVTEGLVRSLRALAGRQVVLGALDTAAHVLARAGLLDGYRATLHWENARAFAQRYPRVRITSNLFEFDRLRVTCAGGTACIDMMLHAIGTDHGQDVAARVSEHFIHERIRRGSEHQRLEISQRYGVYDPKVIRAIQLMEQQMDDPMEVRELAGNVKLSGRQLMRLFQKHLGKSPGEFYLHLRLEHARRLILQSDLALTDVAVASGFQSQAHFSRVYRKQFGQRASDERRLRSAKRLLMLDRPEGR